MTSTPTRHRAAALDGLRAPFHPADAHADALPATRPPAPPPPDVEELADDIAPYDPATFDPAEFEWRPVPRRPRADGWTPDVQRGFIQELAATGLVEHAARAVDMSVQSAYRLRHAPGGEGFSRAWDAVMAQAAQRALDVCFTRAIEGEYVPLFDRDGCRAGARWRTSDRLLMFLLRAYMPDRFRHANRDGRDPRDPPPPPPRPLADAIEGLAPPVPPAPHLLMDEERMGNLVEGARGRAAVEEENPRDDREYFAYPKVEPDSAAACCRRHRRHQREIRREAREDALFGPIDPRIYAETPDPDQEPIDDFETFAAEAFARAGKPMPRVDEEEVDDLDDLDDEVFEDEDLDDASPDDATLDDDSAGERSADDAPRAADAPAPATPPVPESKRRRRRQRSSPNFPLTFRRDKGSG